MFNFLKQLFDRPTLIVAFLINGNVWYLSNKTNFKMTNNKNTAYRFHNINDVNKTFGFDVKTLNNVLVVDSDDNWTTQDIIQELFV